MAWFGVYEGTCRFLTPTNVSREDLGALQKVVAGGLAGVVFWAIPFPADVVKSCMQTMPANDARQHLGFFAVLRHIVKNQGFFALYRGFGVTALRAAPCNGAIFLCYEATIKFLDTHFYKKSKI